MTAGREMRAFLDKLYVEFGICLPAVEVEKILRQRSFSADEIVRQIFEIEGLDPDMELKLSRQVKRRFTDRFGSQLT